MRIGGVTSAASAPAGVAGVAAGGGGGKRARVKKRIAELEERKRRLMEKLAGMAGGGVPPSAAPPAGDPLARQAAKPSPSEPALLGAGRSTLPGFLSDAGQTAAAEPGSNPAPTPARPVPLARVAPMAPPQAAKSSPPSADDLLSDDPKLLMKLILALDMMIMALRRQLAEDGEPDGPRPPEYPPGGGGQALPAIHGDTVAASAEIGPFPVFA